MRLVWTRNARDDRRAIFDYIEPNNPEAASRLDETFSARAAKLAARPLLGGRVNGTWALVVHRNDILVYDVTADEVRILRVLHAARRWPPAAGT